MLYVQMLNCCILLFVFSFRRGKPAPPENSGCSHAFREFVAPNQQAYWVDEMAVPDAHGV